MKVIFECQVREDFAEERKANKLESRRRGGAVLLCDRRARGWVWLVECSLYAKAVEYDAGRERQSGGAVEAGRWGAVAWQAWQGSLAQSLQRLGCRVKRMQTQMQVDTMVVVEQAQREVYIACTGMKIVHDAELGVKVWLGALENQ